MNKFLVWFKNGITKHFESEEEMFNSVKDFEKLILSQMNFLIMVITLAKLIIQYRNILKIFKKSIDK